MIWQTAWDLRENAEKRIEMQEKIAGLGHIEQAILYLWVSGYSQREIGKIFGYSQQRISQIMAAISKKPEL